MTESQISMHVWTVLAIATFLISGAALASPVGLWIGKKIDERFNRR